MRRPEGENGKDSGDFLEKGRVPGMLETGSGIGTETKRTLPIWRGYYVQTARILLCFIRLLVEGTPGSEHGFLYDY